jgi:hypothetical protein
MKIVFGNACVLLGLFQSAIAQDRTTSSPRIEFECGGAQISIDSGPKGFRSPEEAFAKTGQVVQAKLVVTRGRSKVEFQSWRDIDYIGGSCFTDARGKHYIVYRAVCGGSGCHDSNWGIIDPATLQEVLKPIGENTARATEILGAQPPPVPRWHSLLVP